MRLAIFGATGRTGRHLVEQALEAGYEVMAFARQPSKLAATHERLTVVQGDATDPASVERAVQGTDAVISVLATSSSPIIAKTQPLKRATQNILAAMKKSGVRRLIISSSGIPQPDDLPDLRFKVLRGFVRLVVPASYQDTVASVQVVRSSDVDWTVARMTPTNSPPTGRVGAGYVNKDTKMLISRSDAAMFMIKEINENAWIRQAPVIYSD
ncbi:MAG: SDR family oxidoreductase [Anaerolineales bacterium]